MSRKSQSAALRVPMKLVQAYLAFTVGLYAFGPFRWPMDNAPLVYCFLVSVQVMLFLGYISSVRRWRASASVDTTKRDMGTLNYLRIAISVNLVFVALNTVRSTGMSSVSLGTFLYKLHRGLTNPGKQYMEKFGSEIFGGSVLTHATVLLSPFLWPVLPLSLYYFKRLSWINRSLTVLALFFEAGRWVAIGTNKGLVDLILVICSIVLIKGLQDRYAGDVARRRQRSTAGKYIVIATLLSTGIAFFSYAISSRVGGRWAEGFTSAQVPFDENAILMRWLPEFAKPTMAYVTGYLAQGYYALSLALSEPFVPMFGVGNSMFLMDNIGAILGIDLYQYTYQARIAYKGWDAWSNWHSIYVWIANDVHFLGVLPVMYLCGKFFGAVCVDTIARRDPAATALFCLFVIMFFYFPANNQVLSYPTTAAAFWGLSAYWILRRHRLVFGRRPT